MAERATRSKRGKQRNDGGRQIAVRPPRKARMGDNNPPTGLTDDEKRIEMNRLTRFYGDYQRDLEVARQSKSVYNQALKNARKKGIDTKAYAAARDDDAGDHGATVLHFAHRGEYLRLMRSPLATQLDLFQNIKPGDFTAPPPPQPEAPPA
jgi:hypothetical protein